MIFQHVIGCSINRLESYYRLASNIEDKATDAYSSTPVKLDAMAQAHIEKHRYLIFFVSFLLLATIKSRGTRPLKKFKVQGERLL